MGLKGTLSRAGVADYPPSVSGGAYVEGDDRSRLHEIVDGLSADELPVARQLLELLARGLATTRPAATNGADDILAADDEDDDEDEDEDDALGSLSSPATLEKLAQLSDEELLRLDALLATDRQAARLFWRERFGEELEDESGMDGVR